MTLISCSKPALIPNPYSSLISRTHFHVSRKTHHVIVHAKFGYAYGRCIEDNKFITTREKREKFELGIVGVLRTSNCSFGAPDIINEIETAGLQVEPDVDRVMGSRCGAPATI